MKLYTAVGRYELRKDGNGMKQPIVTVNARESALSFEEMILWTSLMWNISTKSEAYELYKKKAEKADMDPERFQAVLDRMLIRNLIVAAEAEKGDEALYKLLSDLYVVPLKSTLLLKVKAFFRLTVFEHVPFSVAKIVFRPEKYTEMEKKVLHLANQTLLSCAEILKCIEENVTDVSTDKKVHTALYNDDYSTCDNLGWFMRFYDNHREILGAISTLYLNRNVVFDKLK